MTTDKIDIRKETAAAQAALDMALAGGAQAARITLNVGQQSSFSVLDGELENLQDANDTSLYIQLLTGSRYGAYSTNRLETEDLRNFIRQAIETTGYLTPDKYRSLPPKDLCWWGKECGQSELDLGQFDPYLLEMTPERKKELAFQAMEEIHGRNSKVVSANTEYGDMLDYQYMIDSQGFEGESLQSNFTVSAECSVKGKGNARSEGWWYESALHFKDFEIKGCGAKALDRALAKLNPRNISGAKYNMIVENTCSSRLVGPIYSALNGNNIQQKNSFLTDKKGQKVFSGKMTIIDRPHRPGMAGSRYWDGEGIATRPLDIIREGRVETFFISTYAANRMGVSPTVESPSVPEFQLDGFDGSLRDLTAKDMMGIMGKGIFVTGFNGGNSNSLTGDFSFGIEGYYFENGEILFPVKEMNISGNIVSLWENFALAGNDARTCSRWLVPTLAFENVDFTGL